MHKYSWNESISDCPEKRFIVGALAHVLLDAGQVANGTNNPKFDRNEIALDIAWWITTEQFFWWCELIEISGYRMASVINDVMRGKWRIEPRKLGQVLYPENIPKGFALLDPDKLREISRIGTLAHKEKRRLAKEQKIAACG